MAVPRHAPQFRQRTQFSEQTGRSRGAPRGQEGRLNGSTQLTRFGFMTVQVTCLDIFGSTNDLWWIVPRWRRALFV